MHALFRSLCIFAPPLLAAALATPSTHAVPEDQHAALLKTEILPYFESHASRGELTSSDGVRLRYVHVAPSPSAAAVRGPHPALVILGGRNENFEKYAELVYDLRDLDWDIYSMDHRGQGFSDHLVPDLPAIGHVDQYADFVDDLELFLSRVVDATPHSARVFLSHSMGGAISALYLLRHPDSVDHLIWAAPMLEIRFPALLSEKMAYRIAAQACDEDRVGCKSKALGGMFENWNTHYSLNQLTHSRARFERTMSIFHDHPEVYLGAPSYGWIRASVEADREIRLRAPELFAPITLLQAGNDHVVRNRAQTAVCAAAPDCELITVPGSRHEILMESDSVRDAALAEIREILRFVAERRRPRE